MATSMLLPSGVPIGDGLHGVSYPLSIGEIRSARQERMLNRGEVVIPVDATWKLAGPATSLTSVNFLTDLA